MYRQNHSKYNQEKLQLMYGQMAQVGNKRLELAMNSILQEVKVGLRLMFSYLIDNHIMINCQGVK